MYYSDLHLQRKFLIFGKNEKKKKLCASANFPKIKFCDIKGVTYVYKGKALSRFLCDHPGPK